MPYKLVQVDSGISSNCKVNRLFLNFVLILGGFIFFSLLIKFIKANMDILREPFKMFSDSNKEFICSKKCCATQWPTSVEIDDNRVNNSDIGKKLLTSNIQCNDGLYNTGCVCVPN
jgi:hypothetical protein